MNKESLDKKWLNNELSESEREAYVKTDDYILSTRILEKAKYFKASENYKIVDFEDFKINYCHTNKTNKLWWRPLLKIACILVIAFGVYFTFFNSSQSKTLTLASEKTEISLPDNSRVVLNALSKIEYDKKDWQTNRSLKLDGEAYFKVAKGNTFDVITKKGKVTVVGTEFNVNHRADYFEVVCFEGIVNVTSDTITRQLLAGDSFRILNDTFSEQKTKHKEPQWTLNTSYFDAIPLVEVLNELERQYNIEVTIKSIDSNRLFTGGFSHNNLEKALKSITQPMGLSYKLNSSNLVEINEAKN